MQSTNARLKSRRPSSWPINERLRVKRLTKLKLTRWQERLSLKSTRPTSLPSNLPRMLLSPLVWRVPARTRVLMSCLLSFKVRKLTTSRSRLTIWTLKSSTSGTVTSSRTVLWSCVTYSRHMKNKARLTVSIMTITLLWTRTNLLLSVKVISD